MEKKFEIIRQDGDDLIFLTTTGTILSVITPAQKAARASCASDAFEFSGNCISVLINDLDLPDTLFPVTQVYDFLIVNSETIKAKSAIADIRASIAYYCTSMLKAGIRQIQIMDLNGLDEVIAGNINEFAEKVIYDFKYFEGGDKKLIYLPDGSFKMGIEERELRDAEDGPILSAALLQPFVDAQPLRFKYDDWEIKSRYVFTILVCEQEIDGFMKPKAIYFDALDFYFRQVLRTNNYLPALPYHSYLFKDG
ncbi:hypothetical protein MTO98_07550 [Mucilaginibacter sp. SMC90]|uniref:hypothetical protein n=1 Tax=Mucilaginibacter sp. SMC90 TaxID=2929803 RepID=UPI001FB3BDEC|nr:hypothetical protein [Mucilaginibacter sp. SMC90]UOE50931.1 hypothetical protein MTO98_07550 [Mucilaginibacter sp. SMC90]